MTMKKHTDIIGANLQVVEIYPRGCSEVIPLSSRPQPNTWYILYWDETLSTVHLTCPSAELSSLSFGSGVASSSSVTGWVVTTRLFAMVVVLEVAGGDRRLGRCVVGTGRAANDEAAVILRLPGALIFVPPTPLAVEKRRVSGGVHTHASIVHTSTDVRYVVTVSWLLTRYTVSRCKPGLVILRHSRQYRHH
jgi:hypothetical protein